MSASTVVVDAHDWVVALLADGADHVENTLLHLRVGTLYRIKLYTATVLARSDRADGTATHTDAVVVTPE